MSNELNDVGKTKAKGKTVAEPAMKISVSIAPEVAISGKAYTKEIQSVRLLQPVNDHHELRVQLYRMSDDGKEMIGADDLAGLLGETLTLKTTSPHGDFPNDKMLSFTGTVTEIRFENSVDQFAVAVVVAKSPTIMLDDAPKSRVYALMKGSDAIKQTFSRSGIASGDVDATQSQFPYIIQYQETDFDFVVRLAALHGLYTIYDGAKVVCVAPDHSSSSETVKWNETLGAFSVNLGTGALRFGAASFNEITGKLYVSDGRGAKSSRVLPGLFAKSESASKQMYGDPGVSGVGNTAHEQALLDTYMGWERGKALAGMIRCSGQASLPAMKAGTKLKVEGLAGIGEVYFLERIEHFIEAGKYHNIFSGTPLAAAYPQPRHLPPTQPQLQTAVVTDTNDPEKLGRIKVQFHWPSQLESDWITYTSPYAGDDRGLYVVPEIGDEVLVGFEHGDPSAPIAIGSIYNKNSKPDAADPEEKNSFKTFKSRAGHKITFSDKDGEEKIEIVTKDKKCHILLDAAQQAITITSEGDMTLKGQNITVDAGQKLILKSATDTEIKAGTNFKAEASASAEIKGSATVNVKADGPVTVKGALINLN